MSDKNGTPVDDGRGYRANIALDDIRCDVLDTGWPLGDDTDPERTPRRLVREVLAELAHVRDQRDNLQAACDRLRANADARERFLRRQGDLLRAAERDAENAEKGAAACDQIVALLDGFPVENPCPEATRVAALVAEVERLRAEAQAERAAVVAYLRVACPLDECEGCAARHAAADDIERGEHRRADER